MIQRSIACAWHQLKGLERPWLSLALVCTTALIISSFFFEHVMGLAPCPLCYIQRYCFMAMLPLLAIEQWTSSNRLKSCLLLTPSFLLCAIGGVTAARQIYLQLYAPHASCAGSLEFLLENFPLMDVIQAIYGGSGGCGEIKWQWFGLSMPTYSLMAFTALGLIIFVCLYQAIRRP